MTSTNATKALDAVHELNASDGLILIDDAHDHIGRDVSIIDGRSFDTLKAASRKGWRDVPGVGHGTSCTHTLDTSVGLTLFALHGIAEDHFRHTGRSLTFVREGYEPGTPPVGSLPYISRVGDAYRFEG